MVALLCVSIIVALLAAVTAKWARLEFSRGASRWPGFIERRVERVRVGEGAFRDQSVENVHERVVPPGMPKPLVASSLAALIAGSPVFVVSALIFSIIAWRVFAVSVHLGTADLVRGAAMLAGALLWLVATIASWRGGAATIQRRPESARASLRVASIAQLLSLLALASVVLTKSRGQSLSIVEWFGALWPLIPLLPIVGSSLVVSRFADEMRGHGQRVVTNNSGVRVESSARSNGDARAGAAQGHSDAAPSGPTDRPAHQAPRDPPRSGSRR